MCPIRPSVPQVYFPPPPRTRWYRAAQAAGAVACASGAGAGLVLALMALVASDATGDAVGRANRAIGWCGWGLLAAGIAFVLGVLLICGTTRTRGATLGLAWTAGAAAAGTVGAAIAAYASGAG